MDYKIVLAANGEGAIAEFNAHCDAIDMLLLDVVMPKLSGPEVYARVCAEKSDVLVIFATGYSSDMELLAKAQGKKLPVIHKPYSPSDLARKVREALDRRVQVASNNAD